MRKRLKLKAKISVYLKPGILDPQGKAVGHAIKHLDYNNVESVRIGKYIEVEFNSNDEEQVKKDADEICNKLLANPVMENYNIEIDKS